VRALNVLSGILILAACMTAVAQAPPANTASACARCHAAQAATQPGTPMARALALPETNAVLKANPKLTVRKGAFEYTVETVGDKSTYTVTDGTNTLSLPIHWNFGEGAQTWVLEHQGQLYESLVSYYPKIRGLDTTVGDEALTPHTVVEAMGRELTSAETKACFGCHASNAVHDRKLTVETLQPGVTCEHCHVGTSTHLLDAIQGQFDSVPPKIGKLSSEDISGFCGQCHRTWEAVVRSHFKGEINVRFQPYRLANSQCFNGTDPRISCVACHDPHQDIVRQDSTYDPKCVACHATSARPASSSASTMSSTDPKPCPVAKENCVSCHMPKVTLPNGHMTFTDHEIRVVKPGDPYPN
jgi:hypothetical protein